MRGRYWRILCILRSDLWPWDNRERHSRELTSGEPWHLDMQKASHHVVWWQGSSCGSDAVRRANISTIGVNTRCDVHVYQKDIALHLDLYYLPTIHCFPPTTMCDLVLLTRIYFYRMAFIWNMYCISLMEPKNEILGNYKIAKDVKIQ